jgi:hypothetical protein
MYGIPGRSGILGSRFRMSSFTLIAYLTAKRCPATIRERGD